MKPNSDVTFVSNLLTVQQAAQVLHSEPLNIMRLIARSDLKAKQLTPDGPYLVRHDDVERCASGLVNCFAMPPIDDGWFKREWYGFRSLQDDVQKLFADQIKDKLERNAKGEPITSYRLPMTRHLFAMLERPVNGPKTKNYKAAITGGVSTFRADVEYRSAVEVAMVDQYRKYVKTYVNQRVKTPTLAVLLQRLYQSPDVYQAAMDYARDFYESAVVSIATHVTAPSDGGIPKTFTVTYELSLRNLYSDTSRLEMLAF